MGLLSRSKTVLRYIPELNDRQLDRLSEFLLNLSLVFVATLVLPNIFGSSKLNMSDLMSGIGLTILFIFTSMILIRKDYE